MSWVINTLWPRLTELWKAWGVEILFAASLVCHIILAVLGSRRKITPSILLRLVVWAAYLLGTNVAAFALGKLIVLSIDNPQNPSYIVELEGLLAPLLLLQLGYPDATTAFAVQDKKLVLRQTMNVGVTIAFVVWVLFRCWDFSSTVSWLYIPLFVAGIIRSVGFLKSVHDTTKDISEDEKLTSLFNRKPDTFGKAKAILKAYHRFHKLQPHLMDWLYDPAFTTSNWMSIDENTPELTFTTTEIELSFVFDALYTKAPFLYTWHGLLGRFISFICLVSTLCGFSLIFKSLFLIDMHVTYTYTMLVAVISLELYQIIMLLFSDWAVVKMLSLYDWHPRMQHIIPALAEWCMKRNRWSRSMSELNLLDYCQRKDQVFGRRWWKPVVCFLRLFGQDEAFRRYWLSSSQEIELLMKGLVVETIKKLEAEGSLRPFTERGTRTLKMYDRGELENSITNRNTFDKSIIIWHIATENLYSSPSTHEQSYVCRGSKLLSDYMMYLLARQPHMLSVTTANITLEHACSAILKQFTEDPGDTEAVTGNEATVLTSDWNVSRDARDLEGKLRRDPQDNKWELICSVWVEMLCYAAYNCDVNKHAKMLGQGGEFITLVWLLLAHQTDKPFGPWVVQDRSPSTPQST